MLGSSYVISLSCAKLEYLSIDEYKCSFYCGAKYVVPSMWFMRYMR